MHRRQTILEPLGARPGVPSQAAAQVMGLTATGPTAPRPIDAVPATDLPSTSYSVPWIVPAALAVAFLAWWLTPREDTTRDA